MSPLCMGRLLCEISCLRVEDSLIVFEEVDSREWGDEEKWGEGVVVGRNG